MSPQMFFDNFALLVDSPNSIAKLRELILQLAFEGKLVPQNPLDEPASALLKRVKAKKAKDESQTRGNKQDLPMISNTSFSLPENWIQVALGEVTNIIRGVTFPGSEKSRQDVAGKVACLRTTNIQDTVEWNDLIYVAEKYVKNEDQWVQHNDILISMANSYELVGKVAQVKAIPVRATFGGFLAAIRTFEIDETYLIYLLRSPVIQLAFRSSSSQTTNIANISLGRIRPLPIPIAPLEEQKRIVAKVDELLRLCDELEARQQVRRASRLRLNNATLTSLNKASSLAPEVFEQASSRLANNFAALYDSAETISKLRSTILQLAVQGKLVPQDPNDEPASVLLSKIKKQKDTLINANTIKQDRLRTNLTENDSVPTLPKGWEWTRLNEILTSLRNGISIPPHTLGNARILRISALRPNAVNIEEYRYLPEAPENYQDFRINAGDLLFTRYSGNRDFVGICGVVPLHNEPLIHPDKLIRGCLISGGLIPEFVSIAMNTGVSRLFIEKQLKTTAGQVGISGRELKMTPVPVPPLEEQNRIVAKVNQLMALCDELETKLCQTETYSEKLMKAAVRDLLASIAEKEKSQRETALALSSV